MGVFKFRTSRIDTVIGMSVRLQQKKNQNVLPGILPATIITLSPRGACLIFPKLLVNGQHLFFDTLDSDVFNLMLCTEGESGEAVGGSIAAQSVWMDSCEYKGCPAFKVGVQFLVEQKTFFNLFK